jgi:iron complex outermembrane receptor protein
VERIEVVKGPVSALYGRNAFAGAINYVSSKAPDQFRARTSLTVGNDGQQGLGLSVGGPLGDRLRVRVAAGYDKYDGAYRDAVNGLRAGGHEKKDMQVAASFAATDKLSLDAAVYYGDDFFDTTPTVRLNTNCGAPLTNATAIYLNYGPFPALCGEVDEEQNPVEVPVLKATSGASGNQRRVWGAHVGAQYGFDAATLKLLTGYNKVTQQRYNNFSLLRDGLRFQLANATTLAALPGAFGNAPELFGSDGNVEDFSQEVRLESSGDARLTWAVGGYYFKGRAISSTLVGVDQSVLPAGTTIFAPANFQRFVTPDGAPSDFITVSEGRDRQTSGFVGLDYELTDALTTSAEARYTKQHKEFLIVRNNANLVPFPFGNPSNSPLDQKTTNYRFSAKYELRPGAMTYLSYANGSKAGGFNQRATVPDDVGFGPENNKTYEVGAKTSWFENRLQFNAALYYVDWTDLQLQTTSSDPNNPGLVTKNFGKASSQGVELDVAVAPLKGLRLSAGIAYTDPKFGKGAFATGNRPRCLADPACAARDFVLRAGIPTSPIAGLRTDLRAIDLNGLQLQRTSKWQFSGSADYTRALTGEWDWFGRLDYRYEAKQFQDNFNVNWWGARQQVGLHTGIVRDNLKFTLFCENCSNDTTAEVVAPNVRLSDVGDMWVAILPQGRRFGLTVEYTFR